MNHKPDKADGAKKKRRYSQDFHFCHKHYQYSITVLLLTDYCYYKCNITAKESSIS